MNSLNNKIKVTTTHRLSLLFIILISGFKLGIAAPADGKKGNGKLWHNKCLLGKMLREKWSADWKIKSYVMKVSERTT